MQGKSGSDFTLGSLPNETTLPMAPDWQRQGDGTHSPTSRLAGRSIDKGVTPGSVIGSRSQWCLCDSVVPGKQLRALAYRACALALSAISLFQLKHFLLYKSVFRNSWL